jgi:glycosyltransferase involved in cell wall biosynthesis
MDKLLILTTRDLRSAPRIIRQVEALVGNYQIDVVGHNKMSNQYVRSVDYNSVVSLFEKVINKFLNSLIAIGIPLRIAHQYYSLKRLITKQKYKVIIVHQLEHLPMLLSLRNKLNFKVIFHAHEYYPKEFSENQKWNNTFGKHFYSLYKHNVKKCDGVINVSNGIAQECKTEFGINSLVVPNAATYSALMPTINVSNPIRFIYHGAVMPGRHIEFMLDCIEESSNNIHFTIMGTNQNSDYYKSLINKYNSPKISFINPVPFNEIVSTLNKYDIGFYILPQNNFNHTHASPNKIYEYLQAKLVLVVSANPEMVNLIQENKIGYVLPNYETQSIVNIINSITLNEVNTLKQNTIAAAINFAAEKYNTQLLNYVNQINIAS